jgi:hypothetical protein
MSAWLAQLPRRLAQACFGQGPWRLAPFAEIAGKITSDTPGGVHRPEQFTGVVRQEDGGSFHYRSAFALLHQPPSWESIKGQPRYRENGVVCASPKLLFSLCRAGIAGVDGLVYSPESRCAVEETVRCWMQPANSHPFLGAVRYPAPQPLSGLSLSLATLDGGGFYHFLHESLPKLWLAREFLPHIDHVLVGGERDVVREAWLGLAGVPAEKIIWLHGLAHYRCEQLLFANLPLRDYQPTGWNVRTLHALFGLAPAPANASRWLWISRSDAQTRQLTWEDDLLGHFPRFDKIVLGRLPPAEQIRLFSTAAVVAGPHGAGFAQLAFCPAGGQFVEVFPRGYRQPVYARLAQAAGLDAAWAMVDFSQPALAQSLASSMAGFLRVPA